jgi:hypothetical protein
VNDGFWPVRAGRRRSPIADNSESKMDPTVLQQKTQTAGPVRDLGGYPGGGGGLDPESRS